MEEIIKTDPLTGEKFVAKRANQRFATKENRIKFHNSQASILNQKRAFLINHANKAKFFYKNSMGQN